MGDLKPGWRRVRFGDIAECVNDRVDDPRTAGVERYVGLEHLDSESMKIRRWGAPDDVASTKLRFRAGDIIFGKRRAYQRKLAVADFEGICSAHAMVLRAKVAQVRPDFLPFLMRSDAFMERAVAISVGSLSPTINWKSLASEEFALPLLEEQRRLSSVLRAAVEHGDRLQSVADHARITASAIVESHLASVLKRFPGCLTTIGDVTSVITKGESPGWQGFNYVETGVRFITSENVLDGRLSKDPEKFVPAEFGEKLARSSLQAGDVLVNIVGGSIGRLCIVPDGLGPTNVNQAVAIVRVVRKQVDPRYLLAVLRSPTTNHAFVSRSVDDYKPNLSLASIRTFKLACPPLDVQEHLVIALEAVERRAQLAAIQKLATDNVVRSLMNRAGEGTV